MTKLLEKPKDVKVLAPLIVKELIYRLLLGGQSARLSYLSAAEDHSRRISRAVKQLRENFNEPLRIEDIARSLGMSASGFHHHFKNVTSMSPIQFQKQLRFQEARR
ncbi:MAG: AraC family transcriptional regulator [Actinomycetota bacterium]